MAYLVPELQQKETEMSMAGHQREFSFKDEAGSVVQEILRDYQGGRSIDRVAAAKEPDRNVIEKIIRELFQMGLI